MRIKKFVIGVAIVWDVERPMNQWIYVTRRPSFFPPRSFGLEVLSSKLVKAISRGKGSLSTIKPIGGRHQTNNNVICLIVGLDLRSGGVAAERAVSMITNANIAEQGWFCLFYNVGCFYYSKSSKNIECIE